MVRWLAHNVQDSELLNSSINFRERYFDRQSTLDRVEFILVLPEYIDANRIEEATDRVSRLWDSGENLLELKTAALIANSQAENPDGLRCIDALLSVRIPHWFDRGNFDLAAKWLKVTRWHSNRSHSAMSVIADSSKFA